jgi:hypothetical protein
MSCFSWLSHLCAGDPLIRALHASAVAFALTSLEKQVKKDAFGAQTISPVSPISCSPMPSLFKTSVLSCWPFPLRLLGIALEQPDRLVGPSNDPSDSFNMA